MLLLLLDKEVFECLRRRRNTVGKLTVSAFHPRKSDLPRVSFLLNRRPSLSLSLLPVHEHPVVGAAALRQRGGSFLAAGGRLREDAARLLQPQGHRSEVNFTIRVKVLVLWLFFNQKLIYIYRYVYLYLYLYMF